jgi:hypothetical protein
MMDDFIMVFLVNLVPIICAISAGVLAYNQIEGWGVFLFVAAITISTPTFNGPN